MKTGGCNYFFFCSSIWLKPAGCLVFILFYMNVHAQTDTVYWPLTTGPGLGTVSSGIPEIAADTVRKGANFMQEIFNASGYGTSSQAGPANPKGWAETDIVTATANGAYVEFACYVPCQDSFTITAISFTTKTSAGTITAGNSRFRYSTTNFTPVSFDVGSGQFTANTGSTLNSFPGLSIPVPPADTIKFRLFGAGIGNKANILYVKDFLITGQVNQVLGAEAGSPFTINCLINLSGDTIGEPSQAGAVYSWAPPAGLNNSTTGNPIANPVSTTLYTLTKTNTSTGCTVTDTVRVTVDLLPPSVSLSNDTVTLCAGDTAAVTAGGADNYSWFPSTGLSATTGASILAFPSGTQSYTVTGVSGSNGCSDTDTLLVRINQPSQPPNSIAGTDVICSGDTAVFSVFGGTLGTGATWNWYSDSCNGLFLGTGISIQVTETASLLPVTKDIFVRALDPLPCPVDTACISKTLTVNPIPAMISPVNDTTCSQTPLHYRILPTFTNNISYSWTSMAGTGMSGNSQQVPGGVQDSVITDTLKNSNFSSPGLVVYKILLTYTNNGLACISDTQTVTVAVEPAPPEPEISNLEGLHPDDTLCGGSEFLSFHIDQVPGFTYNWYVSPSNVTVHLSDTLHAPYDSSSVIITFPDSLKSYQATVQATTRGQQSFGRCKADTSAWRFIVTPGGITERGIILRQPGNLLVYLDNTVSGYQWGYDSIPTLKASVMEGQVYQAFVPVDSAKFLVKKNGISQLDTSRYIFWVDAYQWEGSGYCISRIYYNGPLARRPGKQPDPLPAEISLSASPNPASGSFNLLVSGNIYGHLKIGIYNTFGQLMSLSSVDKTTASQDFTVEINHLSGGLYMVYVFNEYGEKYVLKLIFN